MLSTVASLAARERLSARNRSWVRVKSVDRATNTTSTAVSSRPANTSPNSGQAQVEDLPLRVRNDHHGELLVAQPYQSAPEGRNQTSRGSRPTSSGVHRAHLGRLVPLHRGRVLLGRGCGGVLAEDHRLSLTMLRRSVRLGRGPREANYLLPIEQTCDSFDTHAHIGLIHDDPVEQLIICEEAKQAGVCGILSISSNLRDFSIIHDNLRSLSHIHYGVGIAPSEVGTVNGDWEGLVEEHAQRERVVAIGEIGLDYFRKYGDRDSQVELFVRQLEVAERLHLPVVIHNRDAGGRHPADPARQAAVARRRAALLLRGQRLCAQGLGTRPVHLVRRQRHLSQRAQPARHPEADFDRAYADRKRNRRSWSLPHTAASATGQPTSPTPRTS